MKVTFKRGVPVGVKLTEVPQGKCFCVVEAREHLLYLKTSDGYVQLDSGVYRLDVDARKDSAFYVVDAEAVLHG